MITNHSRQCHRKPDLHTRSLGEPFLRIILRLPGKESAGIYCNGEETMSPKTIAAAAAALVSVALFPIAGAQAETHHHMHMAHHHHHHATAEAAAEGTVAAPVMMGGNYE